MQFLVVAYDGDDDQALARRMAVREEHLKVAHERNAAGQFTFGGAMLTEQGTMVGSALLVDAEDEAGARALVEADVYWRTGVWVRYDIWPFKRIF